MSFSEAWTKKNASTAGCKTSTVWWSGVSASSDKQSLRASHNFSNFNSLLRWRDPGSCWLDCDLGGLPRENQTIY